MCSFDMSCDEEEEIELKSIKCAVCVCLDCKRKDTCRCCIACQMSNLSLIASARWKSAKSI